MSGERTIGPVDTMWLNMDRPNNLMVIDSVMWFDAPVDWDRYEQVLQTRLIDKYPVFSQRPVAARSSLGVPLGMPHWEDDPDFHVSRHITRMTLPDPGDQATLERFIEDLMPVPLDRSRPLWHAYFIDGFGSGAAVVSRFHHSLADGIALAQVLLSLTDETPEGPVDTAEKPRRGRTARADAGTASAAAPAPTSPSASTTPTAAAAASTGGGPGGGLLGAAAALAGSAASSVASSVVSTVADGASTVASGVTGAVKGGLHLLSDLPHLATPEAAADAINLVTDTGHIATKLLIGHTPDTPITGTPGPRKRAAWCEPRDLDEIKRVARVSGGTVNDVMIAAVSGAIHDYMQAHGGTPVDVTTMVPVNVRPPDKPLPRELGNQFALVLLPLPTATDSPIQRLAEAKRRMDSIKNSPESVITFGLISAIGYTVPEVEKQLVNFFTAKAVGVTTNVPGPTSARYLAGTRIAGTLAWVPASGDHAIGVSIFSYDGQVFVGFKTDAGIIPDVDYLIQAFGREMDELQRIAHAA